MPKICAYILCKKTTDVPAVENATVLNILNEENAIYVCKNTWIKSLTLAIFK